MKVCQKCQQKFIPIIEIDGKRRLLYKRKFCLECSPFGIHNTTDLTHPVPTSVIDKISLNEFKKLIESSTSRTDVFLKLKLRKGGASFRILNRRIKIENLDISHFVSGGRTHAKGCNRLYTDEDVYIKNSKYSHIRWRVIQDNFMSYECSNCRNNGNWMGATLTLALDHINGNRYDNRKENLRWLCPNCHSQTDTFCRKTET